MPPFDMAQLRAQSRRQVDDLAAVPAVLTRGDVDRPITVRWKGKQALAGIEDDGALLVSRIEALIFNAEKLAAPSDGGPPIVLARNDIVTIPSVNAAYRLETPEETDGPINVYWMVARR